MEKSSVAQCVYMEGGMCCVFATPQLFKRDENRILVKRICRIQLI